MRFYQRFQRAAILAVVLTFSTVAQAGLFPWTTQVDSWGYTSAPSPVLQTGVMYTIEAVGKYVYNGANNNWADAEFHDDGVPQWDEPWPETGLTQDQINNQDLFVNGAEVDWEGKHNGVFALHTYSDDNDGHVYRITFIGTGQPITFNIHDGDSPPGGYTYQDNYGYLTVTILPEPATLSLLAIGGLAVIRKSRRSVRQ